MTVTNIVTLIDIYNILLSQSMLHITHQYLNTIFIAKVSTHIDFVNQH